MPTLITPFKIMDLSKSNETDGTVDFRYQGVTDYLKVITPFLINGIGQIQIWKIPLPISFNDASLRYQGVTAYLKIITLILKMELAKFKSGRFHCQYHLKMPV